MKERESDKTTWDSRLVREEAEPVVPLGPMRLLLTLDSEEGEGGGECFPVNEMEMKMEMEMD